MAEWLKAHAWKACGAKALAGSNPVSSAVNEVNKEEKKPSEGFWYRIRKAFAIDSTKGRIYPKG